MWCGVVTVVVSRAESTEQSEGGGVNGSEGIRQPVMVREWD